MIDELRPTVAWSWADGWPGDFCGHPPGLKFGGREPLGVDCSGEKRPASTVKKPASKKFLRKFQIPSDNCLLMTRFLNSFFHHKGALWGIPVLIGAGVSFLTTDMFGPAYVCFVASGGWALMCWIYSDFIQEKRRLSKRSDYAGFRPRQETTSNTYPFWLYSVSFIITLATLTACLYLHSRRTSKELSENRGSLVPASDPTPNNACSNSPFRQKDDYTILLGNEAAFFKSFPHTVIAVHRKIPLLWLTLDKNGGIEVNADIRSPDMKLIAKLRQNRFDVNPNEIFTKERPDFSTLRVTDSYGNEVLRIRFLNPHTISVTGVLFYPGVAPIIISLPRVSNFCFGNNGIDINID